MLHEDTGKDSPDRPLQYGHPFPMERAARKRTAPKRYGYDKSNPSTRLAGPEIFAAMHAPPSPTGSKNSKCSASVPVVDAEEQLSREDVALLRSSPGGTLTRAMFGPRGVARGATDRFFYEDVELSVQSKSYISSVLALDQHIGDTQFAGLSATVCDRLTSVYKTKLMQLDTPMRELSQAEIFKYQDLVQTARNTEYQSFQENDTFKVIDKKDVPPGRRLITARELLQWKEYLVRIKCRVVLRGFQDDRADRPVDSPTLRSESWRLLIQQAADYGWDILKFDLKEAFLQGWHYTSEDDYVYWHPPPFFKKYYGMRDDQVCVALKSIYGLDDAPRKWYERLAEAFMATVKNGGMGLERHWLDPCLFQSFVSEQSHSPEGSKAQRGRQHIEPQTMRRYADVETSGTRKTNPYTGLRPVLSLGAHVDDIFATGTPAELKRLEDFLARQFKVGKRESASDPGGFLYRGISVQRRKDGSIDTDMHEYIEREIKPVKFTHWGDSTGKDYVTQRLSDKDKLIPLTRELHDQYRAVIGKLIWCVCNIRFTEACQVSQLASGLCEPTRGHVVKCNKLLDDIVSRPVTITYRRLADLSVPRRIEIAGDAAFKNKHEPNQQSRGGMLAMLGVPKDVNDYVGLLGWDSKKFNRVCKSPTGGEVLNASGCADEADFLFHLAVSFYPTLEFTSILYTDSFSLTSTQDKYTKDVSPNLQVDVALIRQKVRNGEISLVHYPGQLLPADGLTKTDYLAQEPMLKFSREYRIGKPGIPIDVVDLATDQILPSLLADYRIPAFPLTEEKYDKTLRDNYHRIVGFWDNEKSNFVDFCRVLHSSA